MRNSRLSGIYFSSILVVIFIIIYIVRNIIPITTPIAEFLSAHKSFLVIFSLFVTLFPIIWLFYSDSWREKNSFFEKLLLFSLAVFLLSPLYSAIYQIFFYIASIAYVIKRHKVYKPYTLYYIFFFYFFIHLISLLWTNDLKSGLDKIGIYSFFLVIPVFFCFFKLERKDIDVLLLVFFRSVTIFVFLSLFSWLYESARLDISLAEWVGIGEKTSLNGRSSAFYLFDWVGYRHPTFNSIGYTIGLLIGFYLAGKKNSSHYISRIELIIYNIAVFSLAVLTQTRAGLLNVLLITFLGVCWLLRNKKKLEYSFISIGIAFSVLFMFLFKDKFFGFISDPIREQLFTTAIAYIKNNIFFGTGIGGMTEIMNSNEFAQSIGYPMGTTHIYPHNQFLGDFMQTGLFGLLTLCAMLINLFYNFIKAKEWALLGFLFCFITIMLIEMPLFRIKGTTFFVTFSCLFMQMVKSKSTT